MKLKQLLTETRFLNNNELITYLTNISNKINNHILQQVFIKKFYKLINKDNKYYSKITNINDLNTYDKKDIENNTLVNFKPTEDLTNKLTHIVDWLKDDTQVNPQILIGIQNIDIANTLADKYFYTKNKKVKIIKDGIEVIDIDNNMSWVKVTSENSLNREGKLMQHCVGSYYNEVKNEKLQIISLRDQNNQPHVTIELRNKDIYQIKGKQNKSPIPKYIPYIKRFITKYNLNVINDLKNIGLVKINDIIYEINDLPDNLTVDGDLDLGGCTSLTHLPDNLKVGRDLNLYNCTSLTHLPDNLKVGRDLNLGNCTSLTHLPDNLTVNGGLYLGNCTSLTHLPDNLTVKGGLYLRYCTSLLDLPDNLTVNGYLDLYNCTSLTHLPDNLTVNGKLDLRNCTSLKSLGDNLTVKGYLDLNHCASLTHLPDNLKVGGNLFLNGFTSLKISDERYKKLLTQVKGNIYK